MKMRQPLGADLIVLQAAALGQLMPMHLHVDAQGIIQAVGPTLAKLLPDARGIGLRFEDLFALRRPSTAATVAALAERQGRQVHLVFRHEADLTLRGVAVPLAGMGFLLNLSYGIWVTEAVRRHRLTVADFAATDLTVEMLYLVEAKSAVMDELRNLNLRLHGAKEVAEEQALTDTLTGLRNRRALDARLEELLDAGHPFGLMHLDLDFFKQVNDNLGHAAGDYVLCEVARILLEETRPYDMVARVGGDEFVLLFPGPSDVQRLGQIARRIIDHLSKPMNFEGNVCKISASIGMTVSGFYDRPLAEQMLADADDALYASKRGGRSQAQLFAPAGAKLG